MFENFRKRGKGLLTINIKRCTGCGRCYIACHHRAINFDKQGRYAVLSNPGQCSECGKCIRTCPNGAISVINNINSSYEKGVELF
ncbi:MAG: Electron transport complex subunit RsxB [Candidatus Ordinivivax streblomastigis]|uniref:Electron transport complex subunit RsxB n=1 Tax=Candidatus Ordinivivax streblomastigis TaxID=2540710 RepID=A0A5M8P2J1_9BACT|nr:MAG: Electron transport complex subunit RsxB [Candidatus Ordinivivax streblomastigis]